MALLTGAGSPSDMLCSAADHASPLSGMTLMYCLMSAFHGGALAETGRPPKRRRPALIRLSRERGFIGRGEHPTGLAEQYRSGG
jgi:hypothetical protein